MIGYMQMPVDFHYKEVYRRGQPQHERFDRFRLKHPSMDVSKRAKIFAPFDALKGFSEAVASNEVQYEFRRELDDEQKEELDRRLGILHNLTYIGSAARKNRVPVSVTYYIPCRDPNNEAYGSRGQYVTVSGICRKIGMYTMLIDNERINLKDIITIENRNRLFDTIWDCEP